MLLVSSFCYGQKDSTVSVTDSTEFISVRDMSIAIFKAGKNLENSFTKKQWDEIMAAFGKEFELMIQDSAARFINRKKPKK